MKKTFIIIACAVAALCSCNKEQMPSVAADKGGEVILAVEGDALDMTVDTKATAISSVPSSLYLERTKGTWKSETAMKAAASKSVSSGKINTGWYQTATPTAYNYYLANATITFAAGGSTIVADNATDVIAGCTQAATTSTTPSVTLNHVFARTGSVTANAPSGYTISNVSWKIKSTSTSNGTGTKGTYNIATKAWSSTTSLAEQGFTGTSDLYLIPGTYTVSVTYTLTKGDYTASTTKTGTVPLTGGKVNNITAACPVIGDGAQDIVISVSLTPWGDPINQNVTF